MSESPQRWLSDLYRASSREEPSASLDGAILAEARRASRSPASIVVGWGAPLAAAAVVVLTVALVIAVRDEPAYTENPTVPQAKTEQSASDAVVSMRIEPKPMAREDEQRVQLSARKRQAQGDAKQAAGIAKPDREAPAAPIQDNSPQAVVSTPASNAEPSERSASAPSLPASPAPALEAREHSPAQPAAAPPSAAARTLGQLSAPGEAAMQQRREQSSAESDRAVPQAKQGTASSDLPKRLESAVDERLTPEAWLERIAKLRAEGRHTEARESLAAFRKRYPDHPLPDALKSF